MTTLLVLLTIIAGSAFAGYRIKTRGLATVVRDLRRFITTQNSKDVVAYRATRRVVLRLWDKLDEYGEELDERHQQRAKEGSTQMPQQARSRQTPRQRSSMYALPTWLVPQQYDELNREVGKGIFNFAIWWLVVFGVCWLVFILFLIAINV